MLYLSVDYLIVYSFLLIILVAGWRAGRNIKDIRTYAIGNKNFSTTALVLTFLATEVGGQGAVNLAGEIGTVGIIVLVTFLSFSLTYLVQAFWIAPKLIHYASCITMGDVMETLYGRSTQVIVGIFNFIIAICCAGGEIVMLGVVTQSLLGIDARWGIVVGGVLLTFYVVHGGIKAVTTTDVLQFLVLLVLLPVLAATALQQVGGIKAVLTNIPNTQLSLRSHPKFSYYLVLFLSLAVFHMNVLDPALIQRMLMAKSTQQLRQICLTLAGFFSTIFLVFMLLGTTGHQLYPTLAAEELVPHMIKTLLPVGLRGLMMAGIIAVVMASADSYLHAAGLTLVHDVLQPLGNYGAYKIDELRWVRYTTLFAGLLIIGLGLMSGEDLYGLLFTSLEFATPLLVFPFFAGILGLKPDQRAFYVSAATTLLAFAAGKFLLPKAYGHFLPLICIVASGLTFFAVHFMRHHGFVIVRRDTVVASQTYVWQPRRRQFAHWLVQLIPTPQRFIQYSQKQVAKYGAPYILFGAFCCINFTLPYFMWEHGAPSAYNLMLYLRVLGGLACGLLIVRDKWPSSLVPYLPTFWHLTLLYCLPFMSTVMFLLTQGSVEWLINVAITIMFLIVLVDWMSFTLLTSLGLALGFLFYRQVVGPISLQLDFSTGYLLVYTCVFATLMAFLFARRRAQCFEAKIREAGMQCSDMHKEEKFSHSAVLKIVTLIEQQVQELAARYTQNQLRNTSVLQRQDVYVAPDFLQYFFPTAMEVLKQGTQLRQQLRALMFSECIAPQRALHSLQACIAAILESYYVQHAHDIHVDRLEDYMIHASFSHLQYAMVHILRFLQGHYGGAHIRLWTRKQEGIRLRLSGQALSPTLVQELFSLFTPSVYAKHMGLGLSQLLLEAHGGQLLCETHALPQETYTEFVLALPTAKSSQVAGMEV